MRICIVSRSVIKGDGQGRANYEITREAIRRGYSVTLVATNIAPDLQQNPLVNWVYIPVKHYPTQLLSSLVFSWRSGLWLREHRHEFDVVQTCGAVTSAGSDVNTVHFVHTAWLQSPARASPYRPYPYRIYQWLYTALNARWEKQAFQRARAIVAVSGKVARELISAGVPAERIHIILNGVDLDEFCPEPIARSPLGLPENVPLALFAGDIRTARKNIDTVLRALVEVPDLHLAVVGSVGGSPYPELAERLAVSDRVYFLDFRPDVADLMRSADLFVFPGRYEPWGLVLLEAMAAGLPAITAATVGAAEVMTPDCGVVLADPEDVGALSRAIGELVRDPARRKRMGRRAREIAEQYSWKRQAGDHVNFFEELTRC